MKIISTVFMVSLLLLAYSAISVVQTGEPYTGDTVWDYIGKMSLLINFLSGVVLSVSCWTKQ